MSQKIDIYFAKNLIISQLGRTVTTAKHYSTFHFLQDLCKAHIETQATQPTQGRAAQFSVTYTFEYVSAS